MAFQGIKINFSKFKDFEVFKDHTNPGNTMLHNFPIGSGDLLFFFLSSFSFLGGRTGYPGAKFQMTGKEETINLSDMCSLQVSMTHGGQKSVALTPSTNSHLTRIKNQ